MLFCNTEYVKITPTGRKGVYSISINDTEDVQATQFYNKLLENYGDIKTNKFKVILNLHERGHKSDAVLLRVQPGGQKKKYGSVNWAKKWIICNSGSGKTSGYQGTQEWTYATGTIKGDNGVSVPNPVRVCFINGKLTVTDVELAFFLLYCIPVEMQCYTIENPIETAKKQYDKVSRNLKWQSLLYGDNSLNISKLRDIAKAMFIQGVDEMDQYTLSAAIESNIKYLNNIGKTDSEGTEKFLNYADAKGLDYELATIINKGTKEGSLIYDKNIRQWFLANEGDKVKEIGRQVEIGLSINPIEKLINQCKNDKFITRELKKHMNPSGEKEETINVKK